jgi:hypothetical protein
MTRANAEADNPDKNGNSPKPTNSVLFSLKIGFFAGLIWGLVRWLLTGLNFTSVIQAFLLDPFAIRTNLGGFYWQAAGLAAFIIMSMLAALVYLAILGRLSGPWPGLLFGAGWWGLVYAFIGPLVGAVPPLRTIGWNSITTDLCLFLLWGLFIGFSIAFELHNEAEREPTTGAKKGNPQPAS